MRAGLCALAISLGLGSVACGPRVSTQPRTVEDDLDTRPEPRTEPVMAAQAAGPAPAAAAPAASGDATRAVAPPGKGLRSGTIARARLVAVLDAGPGTFLRQLEVAPRMAGERFVGWQLVQLLDRAGPLHDLDLAPGDVLLAINGKPLSRPEQLAALWDSLRTANDVIAQLWRGDQKLELRFTVDPPVAVAPSPR